SVLKRTYWFDMTCDDSSPLVPQAEEGITAVKWISKEKLDQVTENTFGSIIEVMKNIK
ncbi:MAG: NUDIX hydrolase, partial [Bacteroidetes bacterium]|nr:NUDIX hydrolase [Bacteroidota bacterium]